MRIFALLYICLVTLPALAKEKKIKGHFQFHGLENRLSHQHKSQVIDRQFNEYLKIKKISLSEFSDKKIVSQGIDRIDQAMAAHASHNKKIPYTLKNKGNNIFAASGMAALKFPSQYKLLSKKDQAHPLRNTVHAKIYYGFKTYQQPTNFIIMLPHTSDSPEKLEKLAKSIVASATGDVSVVLLSPPLYGKRGLDSDKWSVEAGASGDTELAYKAPKFFVPDEEATFHNMAQTVIDIYTLQLFLQQWTHHKKIPMGLAKKKMTLGGPSLGGIMALGYGGILGGFDKYFSLVGGGNIPLFLDTLIRRKDIVLAISENFTDAGWTFRDSVQAFMPWDPLVWAHRVQSDVMMVNACNDEFLEPASSVLNLQDIFRSNGSRLTTKWNDWGHNPMNASKLSLYFKFVSPLGQFAMDNWVSTKSYKKKCQ